jgi:hypothetical protein
VPRSSPYEISLSHEERRILETRVRKYTLPYRDVFRASLILLAAGGLRNDQIAERLNTRREIVSKWRKRFFEERLEGLDERDRAGSVGWGVGGGRSHLSQHACDLSVIACPGSITAGS